MLHISFLFLNTDIVLQQTHVSVRADVTHVAVAPFVTFAAEQAAIHTQPYIHAAPIQICIEVSQTF
jgi:hypothetical protein